MGRRTGLYVHFEGSTSKIYWWLGKEYKRQGRSRIMADVFNLSPLERLKYHILRRGGPKEGKARLRRERETRSLIWEALRRLNWRKNKVFMWRASVYLEELTMLLSSCRLSTFITTTSLQSALMTSARLDTTPKRLLIRGWAFSATQSSTGRSSHPPSDVSMCALPFSSETTSSSQESPHFYNLAKIPLRSLLKNKK